MLFRVEATKSVFDLNPELRAIPEFDRLTERQMVYVVLATDYKSPFRKLVIEDRKLQAALVAGYKMMPDGSRPDTNTRNLIQGKTLSVEAAIKVYSKMQRDEDYETLMSLSTLIMQIREFNNKPDKTPLELEKAVAMNVGKLDKLIETKKKIEDLLDMRIDEQAVIAQTMKQEEIGEDNLPLLSQINEGTI